MKLNFFKYLAYLSIWLWSPLLQAEVSCSAQVANQGAKRVAIVAAVSSGAAIAPRFKAKGVDSVHVMPELGVPAGYKVVESDFIASLPFNSDFEKTVAELKALGVVAVLAGSEMGVELADRLSEALGLRTNGTRLSVARRNKFVMQETIKNFRSAAIPDGVPGIRQRLVKTFEQFEEWHRNENQQNWPVVIKPYQSAGTDGLFICENTEQVKRALTSLIGKKSFLGNENDELLVQEYLNNGTRLEDGKRVVIPGDEYVVDTISLNGKRIVTDIWRYHKTLIRRPEGGLSNIYDFDELLDFNDPIAKQLVEYSEKVLTALEINHGPSHMEIMMTERGPVLVEVGARLIGGGSHLAAEAGTGVNPIEILYEAYLDEEAFLRRYAEKEPLKRKRHIWTAQFIAHQSGTLEALPRLDEVRNLPTANRLDIGVKVGDRVAKTIDLLTSPGQVIFAHEEIEKVRADHARLRELERQDFFVLKP